MTISEWYDQTNLVSVALLVALSGMVSHRIWRMAARDTIFDRPREAILPQTGFFRDLVECPWCLGFWLNVAIAALLYVAADISFPSALIVAFAGSTVTGVIGRGD